MNSNCLDPLIFLTLDCRSFVLKQTVNINNLLTHKRILFQFKHVHCNKIKSKVKNSEVFSLFYSKQKRQKKDTKECRQLAALIFQKKM